MSFESLLEDQALILDADFRSKSNLLYILTKQIKHTVIGVSSATDKSVFSVFTVDISSKEVKCVVDMSAQQSIGGSAWDVKLFICSSHILIIETASDGRF